MQDLPHNIRHAREPGRFIGTDDVGVDWYIRQIGGLYFMRRENEPLRTEHRSLADCSARIARSY